MDTPILLLGFNRLDTFQEVIPRLKKIAPKKVYIACDGPRNPAEKVKTDAVRDYLLSAIDWTPHVQTLFRDVNLGCGKAVSGGITWFFEHEEAGIILEDDCLPHPDFFSFCARNLERYRDDARVSMICGTNYLGKLGDDYSYEGFFSQYYPIWGWATWRRAWKNFDLAMPGWEEFRQSETLKHLLHDKIKWKTFRKVFDMMGTMKLDTWDIPWVYAQVFQSSYALVPAVNLISNIGMIGTHDVKNSPFLQMPTFALDRPPVLPSHIVPRHDFDYKIFKIIEKWM